MADPEHADQEEPCGVCGSTDDSHDNRMHRAFFDGRASERADVVAYLRRFGEPVAENIERGEHRAT